MFLLELERGPYLRVRGGVKKSDIERAFAFPVNGEVYEGAVVCVLPPAGGFCIARPGDDYNAIAQREGVDCAELEKLNNGAPLYASKKVWLP